MKTLQEYPKKTFLGIANGENIYLSAPSWDCGWYWGFGYIGNNNCHYHISGLGEKKNLHDGLLEHFGKSLVVRPSQLWEFAELFQSMYKLKDIAEVYGRGGTHLCTNPCKDLIINTDEVTRINTIVLPAIFHRIYIILDANKNNKALFTQLADIYNIEHDTQKTVDFMFKNNIKTDDLKSIESIALADYYVIHSLYYKILHSKK